ncbi:MAG: hypothetical protein ACD_13C00155G0002 [uncultured bacterium]|nr:MAG: hypothetical protein ACD_13C00155G0002 [uncultured bacterium]
MERRIEIFVRDLLKDDDNLNCPGNCRRSVTKIKEAINEKYPDVRTEVLVHPDAKSGYGVHYALQVEDGNDESLINVVKAPGFPVYIGEPEKAPPTFGVMKKTVKVV